MRIERSIPIAAPPAVVFGVWADVVRWPEWTASISRITPLGDAALAPGARFRVEQPKLRPAVYSVTRCEVGQRFTWAASAGGVRTVADHTLTPTDEGCVAELLVTLDGWPLWFFGGWAQRMSEAYLELEAEGLRARAEGLVSVR